MPDDVLTELAATIKSRRQVESGSSYTKQLLDAGPPKCARKFGEEATEAIVASLSGSPDELRAEAADVLYHLLVLLEVGDVRLADVLATLQERTGMSGLEEKASRDNAG